MEILSDGTKVLHRESRRHATIAHRIAVNPQITEPVYELRYDDGNPQPIRTWATASELEALSGDD